METTPFSSLSVSSANLLITRCHYINKNKNHIYVYIIIKGKQIENKKAREIRRKMGRGKVEIKRIENSNIRQVTYSNRRNGILKKAKEISVLCDAQVSLIIFASSGKMHDYCSPNSSLINILDAYQKQSGIRLWDARHENLSNEIERVKKENDNMQIEFRYLKGEDIQSLHHKELMSIEDALENGLTRVRERQMEIYRMAKDNVSRQCGNRLC